MLSFEEARKQYRGRAVISIVINAFRCEDQTEIVGIVFLFEDDEALSIRLNGDGTGFILEDRRPEKLNLGEFGRTTMICWNQFSSEVELPNILCDIEEASQPYDGDAACPELKISLANSQHIILQNCGDQLELQLR